MDSVCEESITLKLLSPTFILYFHLVQKNGLYTEVHPPVEIKICYFVSVTNNTGYLSSPKR